MHDWEVRIHAAKEENQLEKKSWTEKVTALDEVGARSTALVQAMERKPCYDVYNTSIIIKVKA